MTIEQNTKIAIEKLTKWKKTVDEKQKKGYTIN